MAESDELREIARLAMSGRRAEARTAILKLEPRVKDPQLRLELIDVASSVLNDVKDNAKKALLSLEGARIAARMGLPGLQAHFMAKSAEVAIYQVAIWHHRRSMLDLPPDWFQFATEADMTEHKSLTTLIDKVEGEIDSRLSQAKIQAEQSGDKRVQASVLMSTGTIESARYLQFKMNCMRGFRAKIWSHFEIARYPLFEYALTFWNRDAQKLNDHVKAFTNSFLEAARLSEEMNDSLAGYAYFNLAVHLRSTYRFGACKKYAAKARFVATKHNDTALLSQLPALEETIKAKNRDIPDYLAGETRKLN